MNEPQMGYLERRKTEALRRTFVALTGLLDDPQVRGGPTRLADVFTVVRDVAEALGAIQEYEDWLAARKVRQAASSDEVINKRLGTARGIGSKP